MRLTTMVLSIALLHTTSAAYAQITLKEKNIHLEKILIAIERQTKFVFLYNPDDVKKVIISINVKNATLKETLEKCFKGLPLEFVVIGNNVLLIKKRLEKEKKPGWLLTV